MILKFIDSSIPDDDINTWGDHDDREIRNFYLDHDSTQIRGAFKETLKIMSKKTKFEKNMSEEELKELELQRELEAADAEMRRNTE